MAPCSFDAESGWGGGALGELAKRMFQAQEEWKGGRGLQSRAVLVTYHCDQIPDKKPLQGEGIDFALGIEKGHNPSLRPECEADDHIPAVRKQKAARRWSMASESQGPPSKDPRPLARLHLKIHNLSKQSLPLGTKCLDTQA